MVAARSSAWHLRVARIGRQLALLDRHQIAVPAQIEFLANGHVARSHDTAVTAAVLRTKTFQPIKEIVKGVIVEGVNLLVSRPKFGKSWMILDICLAATSNRFTLGDIKPMQCDVLYLALEDSQRRLQKRIDKLLDTFN
jgi:RecA-family ATPase